MKFAPKIHSHLLTEGNKKPSSLLHVSKTAATIIIILSSYEAQKTKETKVPVPPPVISNTFPGLDKKEIAILERIHNVY